MDVATMSELSIVSAQITAWHDHHTKTLKPEMNFPGMKGVIGPQVGTTYAMRLLNVQVPLPLLYTPTGSHIREMGAGDCLGSMSRINGA